MQIPRNDFYEFPEGLEASEFLLGIEKLPYRVRRTYCWENLEPRIERFTYKYSSLNPLSEISIDRSRDILVHSRIWLSSPEDFNDPFDCQAQISDEPSATKRRKKVDQLLRKFEPNLNGSQRKRRVDQMMTRPAAEWFKVIKASLQEETKSLGVTCFSDDPRGLLMWSHYSANHTGLCYQFETLNDPALFGRALPIQYTRTYPTLNPFTYGDDESIRMLLTKYEDWKYEKERRVIAPGGARKFMQIAPASLSGVVLGTRIRESTLQKLREILNERKTNGLPDVRIFKAKQHASSYRLTLHQTRDFL